MIAKELAERLMRDPDKEIMILDGFNITIPECYHEFDIYEHGEVGCRKCKKRYPTAWALDRIAKDEAGIYGCEIGQACSHAYTTEPPCSVENFTATQKLKVEIAEKAETLHGWLERKDNFLSSTVGYEIVKELRQLSAA